MPEMRAWFRTKYEGRRHRTALEYAPRKTIVAMHFRAGGIVGSHMFRGRWIEPEWYIATVRRILSVSSLDATAATGDTELWLFSEGRADEPHFVTLRNGFAGLDLKVRLGSGDDVPETSTTWRRRTCSSPRTRRSRSSPPPTPTASS